MRPAWHVWRGPLIRQLVILLGACLLCACGGEEQSSQEQAATPRIASIDSQPCSLAARQQWALDQIDRWHLYPDLIDRGVDAGDFGGLATYIDALLAPARAAGVDRHFTFVTPIADENAFFVSGKTVGFGFSLALTPSGGLFIRDRFEGSPADQAGLARADQVLAVGTHPQRLTSIIDLAQGGGDHAVSAAIGEAREGEKRWFRIATGSSNYRDIKLIQLEQREFTLLPISPDFGARIINGNIGYLNLRTFIDPAGRPMREAFDRFRTAGIERIIIDLRYNRGGLVRIADYLGDLMGDGRTDQVFSYTIFRPEQASRNVTQLFQPQPQSIAPRKIAFITTADTASASEIIMNAMHPHVRDTAMIGLDTLGKPVGQIAIDNAKCGDRLRVVAFRTENAQRQGDYFNGLSGIMPFHCRIGDEWQGVMGDPGELMTRRAIDWMEGRLATCRSAPTGVRALAAINPIASQRYMAGSF